MARKETPWGVWDHIPLEELTRLLGSLSVPWWIAGGYAIDAFAGARRREHDDIDVGAFASDQLAIQSHCTGWDLHYADPPRTLNLWPSGFQLPAHVHDIWARQDETDPWRFQFMLNPGGPDTLAYRRDERVASPFEEATWLKDGVRYLAPRGHLPPPPTSTERQ